MGDCLSTNEQQQSGYEYTPPNPVAKKENKKDETQHDKAIQYGLDIMRKGFVKVDHFDNIYRLQPKFDGAPNLRQVAGFNIFGTGQPNKSAIISLLNIWFNEMNLHKCLWINMRSEPVIYVKDISLAPRDPKHPSENIDFDEDIITIDDLTMFNIELEKTVKQNIENNNHICEYHKDTYAPLPADRKDRTLQFKCDHISNDVYGLQSLYDNLRDKQHLNVELQRITVLDEKAPQPKDIVKMVDVINKTDHNTVIIFNCMMGKGRTTEGMIMACLIKQAMTVTVTVTEQTDEEKNNQWPNDIPDTCEEFVSFQKKIEKKQQQMSEEKSDDNMNDVRECTALSEENMRDGNFELIETLVHVLTNEYKLNGKKIKQETDDIINKCQHLQNMRECIYLTLLRYINESRENEKGYWKKISKQYLERYYVLIVFNAYLNDIVRKQKKSLDDVKYTEWISNKPLVYETMGTLKSGALATFNWN